MEATWTELSKDVDLEAGHEMTKAQGLEAPRSATRAL